MNFNVGGSSNVNDNVHDEDEQIMNDLEALEAFHDVVVRMYLNNNILLTEMVEQQQTPPTNGGSIPGHIVINYDRESAHERLFNDYFAANPQYDERLFRRCYRMSRNLFLHILQSVESHDSYFVQKWDGLGRLGLSSLKKITTVFQMLAYGIVVDATDEYCKIGESTTIKSLKKFCNEVVEVFGSRYLRSPNANDIARLLHVGQQRGFPEMLGSLDCMHWRWKNCPTAWTGQYAGRSGSPTIVLEAVADYDLWI